MTKDIYTVKDIAEQTELTEKTIRNLIKSGELKAKKVANKWIISAQNLKEFLET